MKRYLLTAASALVIAAAASAQTAKFSGQVSASLAFDGLAFSGPTIFGHPDDELRFSFTGNGAGRDYAYETDGNSDLTNGTMTFENDTFGSFELSQNAVSWSREIFGPALGLGIEFDPADLEAFAIALQGNVRGVEYDVVINNEAVRTFASEVTVPFLGVIIGANVFGDLNDTSDLVYELEFSANLFGIDTVMAIDEAATINLEANWGAFGLALDATDGDLFNPMTFTYEQDVTELMTLSAYVDLTGHNTQAGSAVTLRF